MSDCKHAIIGYSGHAFVVAEAAKAQGLKLQAYTDLQEKKSNPFQLTYLGDESQENFNYWNGEYVFILGIGSNVLRQKVGNKVLGAGCTLDSVKHPSVELSTDFQYGAGLFVSKNVSVNPLVKVGKFCVLNTACIVEHECQIGDAVHIAPGAVLLGNVTVGNGTFIGANSVVKQGVKIGANVTIGAGCVVLKDVSDGSTMVGNPARKI